MKVKRYHFGAREPGESGFRTDLYVYDLREVDSFNAASILEGNGEERILVHNIGHGNIMITFKLYSHRFHPQGCVWGEEFALMKTTFDEFIKSLESWETIESNEEYSLYFIEEEDVEI
jgi:hypothetical protein